MRDNIKDIIIGVLITILVIVIAIAISTKVDLNSATDRAWNYAVKVDSLKAVEDSMQRVIDWKDKQIKEKK